MSRPLVFMMGQSPVFLPVDRQYTRSHLWTVSMEDGRRFGFTGYAVKLLGDVRHIGWCVEPPVAVERGRTIGFVEASKATSDLYAPLSGRLVQTNASVLTDPTLINTNLYDDGWLVTIAGDDDGLLSAEQYLAHVEATWPLAQRLLKGQAGR